MTGLSSIPGLVNTGEQKRTWLSLKLKKITVERSRVRIQTHTIVFKAFIHFAMASDLQQLIHFIYVRLELDVCNLTPTRGTRSSKVKSWLHKQQTPFVQNWDVSSSQFVNDKSKSRDNLEKKFNKERNGLYRISCCTETVRSGAFVQMDFLMDFRTCFTATNGSESKSWISLL